VPSCRVGGGCHVVAYTIRQGRDLNIVCTQPFIAVASPTTYLAPAHPSTIQARYAGWDPRLTHMLSRIADNSALEWKLCDLPPLATWVFPGGKVVLMGDACHAMLPSAGQGACMAIEDGCAIAELLGRIGPRPRLEDDGPGAVQAMKDRIPGVLRTFEALRKDRCAMVAQAARDNAKRWHANEGEVKARAPSNWIWDYDVEREARRCDILPG
jgi:salicylate hydroxylase